MADPRFYDNRGPFALSELCAAAGVAPPEGADPAARIFDVAGLRQAGPLHFSFFEGARLRADFLATQAGWCFVKDAAAAAGCPPGTVAVPVAPLPVPRAFAAVARLFYPVHELGIQAQDRAVHPSAQLGEGVVLDYGVVVGPGAEIGAGTRIGPHAVIGRGVAIGRDCEIGAHAVIGFAHIGDRVVIQPGVVIGASGFGFTSARDGHVKTPQLGRVIVQDRVEIGANSTVDRGALADTVIGEGSKIDNLVQIGHNTEMGRHCIVAGQAGISGSVVLGDFVIIGGNAGVADHVTLGTGARLAAKSGVMRDIAPGRDYGGVPARPIREWHRETAALAKLAKKGKPTDE
jgi:UDP-3-O-[3-hydroxymyristoyl] glucosamine N-acyltransferase